MKTLKSLSARYVTPTNVKLFYVLLSLVTLAIAAGAPGAESGIGGR
jgi:hypothetical protein